MGEGDDQQQPRRRAQRYFDAALAVGFNLVPIIGVAVWGWSAFALVFLYWLENIVIGLRTAIAIVASGFTAIPSQIAGALAVGAFFAVHYGLFCFVHGVFVVSMFAGDAFAGDAFDLPSAAGRMFALFPNLQWGLASVVAWQAFGFLRSLHRGDAKQARPYLLVAEPYPRIVVLHVTILIGGATVMLLDEPLVGVVALAVTKTAFDIADAIGVSWIPAVVKRRLELSQ